MPALPRQPFVRAASFKPLLSRQGNVASWQGARGSPLPDEKAEIIASSPGSLLPHRQSGKDPPLDLTQISPSWR